MRATCRKVIGDAVADRCRDVWDLDGEGEVNVVSYLRTFSIVSKLTDFLDVETKRTLKILVHGRKPRALSDLLEIPGFTDQGY